MKQNPAPAFGKDFVLVVIGQIISLFGNAILRFALPLALLRQTGSAALFGLVSACSFAPMILLSLVGGVLADRVNKRNIMVLLDFFTALLILGFGLLQGSVPAVPLFIVTLMLLYGISGMYQPTVQASIPVLVAGDKLMVGNAMINQVSTLAGLLGPVIGGMLFGRWGLPPILITSAICFALSALLECFIRIPHQHRPSESGPLKLAAQDLKEATGFVRTQRPGLIGVALLLCAFNLVFSAAMVVGVPVLVVQRLGLSDALLGATQGAMALGGLLGGILAGLLAKKLQAMPGQRPLQLCALTMALMGMGLLPGIPAMVSYSAITLLSMAMMAISTLFTVQILTLVQQQTPPHLIGKVMACAMALVSCSHPIGQAVYGLLFTWFAGADWALLLVAAAISWLIAACSRRVFQRFAQEQAPLRQEI